MYSVFFLAMMFYLSLSLSLLLYSPTTMTVTYGKPQLPITSSNNHPQPLSPPSTTHKYSPPQRFLLSPDKTLLIVALAMVNPRTHHSIPRTLPWLPSSSLLQLLSPSRIPP